jgi:sugar lactone lactonase YvrE
MSPVALTALLGLGLAGCIRDDLVQSPVDPNNCANVPSGDEVGKIYTIAGTGSVGYEDGVKGTCSPLYFPVKPYVDPVDGAVLFIDWNNHRVRRIDPATGLISTLVNLKGALGDDPPHGPPNTDSTRVRALDAALNHPTMLQRHNGKLYMAAWHNHRIKVVEPDGMMQTLSGSSEIFGSFSGDNFKAYKCQHNLPSAIAFDDSNNIYVSDQGNFRIRKINPDTIITTYAGNSDFFGYAGDGQDALNARFWAPRGADAIPAWRIAIDNGMRRLYIADTHNNRVRYVNMDTHTIEAFAGSGPVWTDSRGLDKPLSPTGTKKEDLVFHFVTDVAVGPDHSVYVADAYHNVIWRIKPDGIGHIIAGTGTQGFSGDDGLATEAQLNHPNGIWISDDNVLYIADTENQRVRRVRIAP